MIDGVEQRLDEARLSVLDPAFEVGWSVFETLIARDGAPCWVAPHLDRLADSCGAAAIGMPDREVLADEIDRSVRGLRGTWRIRVTLTGGGRRVVTAIPLDPSRLHGPVRATRRDWRPDPLLGGFVKHGSRASWVAAVRNAGVDEVLLVVDGRLTEGTTSAILAVRDGTLWSAPHDGRILESVTARRLLGHASGLGIPVRREGPPADGPWDALYVASTTRSIAPVVALDGEALPGWEPVGEALRDQEQQQHLPDIQGP